MNDLDIQLMHTRLKETGEDRIVFKNAEAKRAFSEFMRCYRTWQSITHGGQVLYGFEAWQTVKDKACVLIEAIGRREVYAEDWA
jgi:hypothetical protein